MLDILPGENVNQLTLQGRSETGYLIELITVFVGQVDLFSIFTFNVICSQLNSFNFANLKCIDVPKNVSSTCFFTERRSGNKLFKIK